MLERVHIAPEISRMPFRKCGDHVRLSGKDDRHTDPADVDSAALREAQRLNREVEGCHTSSPPREMRTRPIAEGLSCSWRAARTTMASVNSKSSVTRRLRSGIDIVNASCHASGTGVVCTNSLRDVRLPRVPLAPRLPSSSMANVALPPSSTCSMRMSKRFNG